MTDVDSYSTSTPMFWGDLTSPSFGWSPGGPLPFADLVTLKADGTDGDGAFSGAAFESGQYVRLGDGSTAYWNGTIWQAGEAAVVQQAAPPAPAASPIDAPGDYTIAEVQTAVIGAADPCAAAATAEANENAGSNRVTLVSWLDGYIADNCEE